MLQLSVDWLLHTLLHMPKDGLGVIINFFVYDTIKILFLLFAMISVIGFFRTYLPEDKVKEWVKGKKILGNVFASFFGAVTPFCSCSSIPIFLSFIKMEVPLGVTFSFLITSPLINEYLVVLMLGFFGWKITLAYVLSGITIGVFVGYVLGKFKLEKYLDADLMVADDSHPYQTGNFKNKKERVLFGLNESISIIKKIWIWILVGVGIGAVIHNYVPEAWIQAVITKTGIFSVPLAAILGVPMYGSCAAIVPIAVALFQKGIPLGTAITFMMATAALSLPEAIMLRRAMRIQLIAIFFFIATLGIIFTGLLLNYLQPLIK